MTNATKSDPFCLLPSWGMRNNFELGFGSGKHCVAFLFKGWNLDTPFKYAVGLIGTMMLATAIEGLGYFRKSFAREHLRDCTAPEWRYYVQSFFFAVSMTMAYLAMLLVMEYETLLFVALIVGYMLGHAIFTVYLPRKAKREADQCPGPGRDATGAPLLPGPLGPLAGAGDAADDQTEGVHSPCCGGAIH